MRQSQSFTKGTLVVLKIVMKKRKLRLKLILVGVFLFVSLFFSEFGWGNAVPLLKNF
jgi:hypothetical protein